MSDQELDSLGDSSPEPSPGQSAEQTLPPDIQIRQAVPNDAGMIHALMRPYVMQRLLLARTEAEIIELTRHGFVAVRNDGSSDRQLIGFSAIEIYSPKLAELQCLAVHHDFRGTGVGRSLVGRCVDRAKNLNVMEVMAISSSEPFLKACGFDYSLPDQKKALFCQLRPRPTE